MEQADGFALPVPYRDKAIIADGNACGNPRFSGSPRLEGEKMGSAGIKPDHLICFGVRYPDVAPRIDLEGSRLL